MVEADSGRPLFQSASLRCLWSLNVGLDEEALVLVEEVDGKPAAAE